MRNNEIILIGGGGHCKSCIEVIERDGRFKIAGILEKDIKSGDVLGYKILGGDEMIPDLHSKGLSFLITIGQIKSADIRKKVFTVLNEIRANLPVIISPSAQVSKYAKIGQGTIIMHNCVINADATLGENCIINTGSIIEHEVKIGNNTHVSTNVVVNGNCIIEDDTFIGSGSVISNGIFIVANTVIGASSLVLKSIMSPGVYISKNQTQRIK